ncbi:MAG: hypothetical protein LRY55_06705 [Leadbetterella sp.]|nr:hypothetical protein [Leadbetterella sp.]
MLEFERGKGLQDETELDSCFIEIDSNNTAFIFNSKYFFKLYRNLFQGINPEIESLRFSPGPKSSKTIPNIAAAST